MMMLSLNDYNDTDALVWTRPCLTENWLELQHGDETLAIIHLSPRDDGAEIRTASQTWFVTFAGFWRTRITISTVKHGAPLAEYTRHAGKNLFTCIASHEVYSWRIANLWDGERQWRDLHGTVLMRFIPGPNGHDLKMVVCKGMEDHPDRELLAVMGGYLYLLYTQEFGESM